MLHSGGSLPGAVSLPGPKFLTGTITYKGSTWHTVVPATPSLEAVPAPGGHGEAAPHHQPHTWAGVEEEPNQLPPLQRLLDKIQQSVFTD